MPFVNRSAVKKYCRERNKWVQPSFFLFLDRKVCEIMDRSIHALAGKTKLNLSDAEAYEQLQKLVKKR